jgi:hypothetical protein
MRRARSSASDSRGVLLDITTANAVVSTETGDAEGDYRVFCVAGSRSAVGRTAVWCEIVVMCEIVVRCEVGGMGGCERA